jgi:hypothetical protein
VRKRVWERIWEGRVWERVWGRVWKRSGNGPGTVQGVKATGRFAGFAPVGGTWRVFRANSMTSLWTGPQIWPPK